MYKLLLCFRYLKTRYIALASVISVMLGVATMIVVNSVMSGFGIEMKDRIRGILSDVVVEAHDYNGAEDPDQIREQIMKVAGPYIEAITPTVETHGILNYRFRGQSETRPVIIVGIDPVGKGQVSPLQDCLQNYKPLYNGEKGNEADKLREALRSPEEELSWELTAEALEYRKKQTELQSWQPQPELTENLEAPTFSGDSEETEATLAETETPDSEVTNSDSPFDIFNENSESPDGPEIGALMEGRAYVGKGLVTYPYTDRQGKHRTMRLAEPGMDMSLSFPTASLPPKFPSMPVTVVDFFECGMSEYDDSLVFVNIKELQRFKGMLVRKEDGTEAEMISSFQIKLKDYEKDSEKVVEAIRASLASSHLGRFQVSTWESKQVNLLAAVEMEKAILNVLLSLIIAVAGFGILAIFFMIVVEKTRDIGILKSLGASSGGVMSIFLSYGLGLGIVGSAAGVGIGLLFVRYINEIEDVLSMVTGRKVFDQEVYLFKEIPTQTNISMVFWVALGAIAIAVLASVMPARRASRLHPVRALRYE